MIVCSSDNAAGFPLREKRTQTRHVHERFHALERTSGGSLLLGTACASRSIINYRKSDQSKVTRRSTRLITPRLSDLLRFSTYFDIFPWKKIITHYASVIVFPLFRLLPLCKMKYVWRCSSWCNMFLLYVPHFNRRFHSY